MFANAIMAGEIIIKLYQCLRYKLKHWKKIDTFDILNNIIKYATLVRLMDSIGNVNNSVSVFWKWIFDSNYEKYLTLNIDSLNLICACSDEDDYFVKFQVVYYAVRYINPKSISNHVHNWFNIIMHNYIYIW